MKTSLRSIFLGAAVAASFVLANGLSAQENQQPDPAAPSSPADKSPAVVTPAESAPSASAPAVTPAPPVAVTPGSVNPAVAPVVETEPVVPTPTHPKLRRLDEDTSTPDDARPVRKTHRARNHRDNGNDIVHVGGDSTLGKGQKADSVVAVFGSSTNEGEVADQVVSVFGNTRTTGPVGDQVIAVFGNVYVNGKVGDQVVGVFGNVELGPNAEVNDVVNVGGHVTRDPKAIVHGEISNVGLGTPFTNFDWLQSWFRNCARYFRPLAFAPGLMWAWWIALGFLGFYILVALLFGKAVNKCVNTLTQHPGFSILAALITVVLAPVVMLLLVFTGVGLAVVPFLGAAIFFASLFGKVVLLAWIGRRLARLMGSENPALATLLGGVLVLLLYTIPFVGLIVYKLLGWIGLGAVVYTLTSGMKRERPIVPPVVLLAPGRSGVDPTPTAAPLVPGGVVPPLMPALALPRAGFWIRLAALLIDLVMVAILCGLLSDISGNGMHFRVRADLLPSLAVYGAIMWKLKGSTVGGIICGLRVIRLDDRPLDWGTTIVRALGCFLSLFVLGFGFFWVIFDDQRQGWHDKIAGTTVVRVPKGVSLV